MKQEVMRIWVDALRSGEYTQGRGCLKSTSGNHCCLGVLCELYDKNNEEKLAKLEVEGMVFFNENSRLTPMKVVDWAGLHSSDGSINNSGLSDIYGFGLNSLELPELWESLANLNDRGSSFQQIADFIEQNVERL
jgi:hypothetical protein